ncbi:GIY-YIG nuclease family protein [Cylindrospermum sp. FACHB-282]|uniref:GIY-YIG nuclease family protein n=1 Tax=Cylindrospermum sp. FACHB-282 TaxID=2692794 RepID=UPI001688A266|nr:GIY-YIG nuclease family protein [Cylindrospermum sp. FACHB-282]MBD2386963.1 GIY-YIG nuclease family protein [Cylindrospermum sp. FACHB-282]
MRETGVIKFFGKNRKNQRINFGFISRVSGDEIYINKEQTCYTTAELAERLGVEESILESEKLKPNLSEWSISKDPKAIEWEYLSETNNFYPVSIPEALRVTFEVVTNIEKGKNEAKSLRILLNQQTSIVESSQPEQRANITINISEDSIDDIDLNSLGAYYPLSRNTKVTYSFDSSENFRQLPLIKRVSTVHFIYCLYLEKLDAIYWGMTSNLTQRMQQHYRGEVRSTREEAVEGKMWILYTLPLRTREEAEKAEKQAWNKSGGGLLTNNNYSRGRQTYLEVEYAGTVARMDFAYRHLINLGWLGTKITLKDFLSHTSKYLQLWDNMGNKLNQDVLAEIYNTEQTKQDINNYLSKRKSQKSELTSDTSQIKKIIKNEIQYLVQYYAYLNDNNQEVISGVIATVLIIADYKNINTSEISILHLEAYETKEEAQKALENINYQIPNIYLYLLDHGWNGRKFNIKLLLSAFSQVIKIQKHYSNYSHNERLKVLRKYIITPQKDEESYDIANIGKRLSTSANVNWRTLLFPQEWIDIYEEYEFRQQNVTSSDLGNRRRLKMRQNRLIEMANLEALLSPDSNTADQFVAESDTTDWTDFGNELY